jgi:hypothetical protein
MTRGLRASSNRRWRTAGAPQSPEKAMPWYSMTAAYHWEQLGAKLPKFERRTTVCSAADDESAHNALLQEAMDYGDAHTRMLGDPVFQEIGEPLGPDPVEVASEMTVAVNPRSGRIIHPEQFDAEYWWHSRIESCDALGFEHSWYNRDGVTLACYNCRDTKQGHLPGKA